MNLDKAFVATLEAWDADPHRILNWRSRIYKLMLLVLEQKAMGDLRAGRSAEAVQLRAIELLNKMLPALDEISEIVPVSCPKCATKFKPGE
jgi:hypothetical protein